MVNGSVPVACSIRVRLSDRRIFPPRPNPRDRNRRNRPRCTGTTTKRTIITSRTTIRMTNRVTEAKRGRVRVEQVAPLSGSGRRDIHSVVVSPSSTELPGPCVGERFVNRAFRLFAWSQLIDHLPVGSFLAQFSPPHVPSGFSWIPSRG